MLHNTFLIEIATEDLPSKHLKNIAKSFYKVTEEKFNKLNITYEKMFWFATSRRLAIKINKLNILRVTKGINKIGPSTSIAFNTQGQFTKIVHLWMQRLSISAHQINQLKTQSGEWLVYKKESTVENIVSLLPTIIVSIIKKIQAPKMMRWNDTNFKFSRPIRNIVALLNKTIIPLKFMNIKSHRITYGHVFMKNIKINILHANQYPTILNCKGKVIPNYDERKLKITKLINQITYKLKGKIKKNDELLQEVTSLVEWPVILLGKFEKDFLLLPQEIVIYIIENVQKCFALYNLNNELMPYFIIISNIDSKNTNKIIKDNEQVVFSRLSDANFFYKIDRKQPLESYYLNLKNTIFYEKLGSIYDKIQRLKLLMKWILSYVSINSVNALRAVHLSKCDLKTNMVAEFPDVQGSVGMHYAMLDRESKDVFIAIKEHYYPNFSGDIISNNSIAYTLAIIDKVDTITGMFIIGLYPEKNKDPFALRRLSIGVLRIFIEKNITIDLIDIINYSVSLHKNVMHKKNVKKSILNFFLNRIYHLYLYQGFNTYVIQSVLILKLTVPIEIHKRIFMLTKFKKMNKTYLISTTNKRILNIINKYINIKKCVLNFNSITINTKLFQSTFEKILFSKLLFLQKNIKKYIIYQNYDSVFSQLIKLCILINYFFLHITISHPNEDIQTNRLLLLYQVKNLFLEIADFSLLIC
ncbi:glycine--tRNA ligase beta subunit [Buchnera aphidicola (Nipponaphis monzeni)]|uniref:Glycine--tRNA ligase beta subunit n=1 Tax=Buchnera aphidicola (Nipponaphis monzeni) TaxID=2495405 RepID=A0A455T9W4_9GAMM|nr:glycine--tRNA ligase subunit beta [Buchnera aphidicola]BBI01122.1 glycine--tRNA ligase beta subunit [Buchnera aphidicola (Nipponaphis monzeni)]